MLVMAIQGKGSATMPHVASQKKIRLYACYSYYFVSTDISVVVVVVGVAVVVVVLLLLFLLLLQGSAHN